MATKKTDKKTKDEKPKAAKGTTKALLEELKQQKIIGIDAQVRVLGECFSDDDFEISKDKKNVFVRHAALLRVAKQEFRGIKKKRSKSLGIPKKQDNFCSVAEVSYRFGNGYEASALADCSQATANRGFKNYTTALAETRASSRALRYALGIEMAASEEITDVESLVDGDAGGPALDSQKELIKRKFLKKKEKGGKGKSYKDMFEIVGRKIRTVDELLKGEATDILQAWNSEKETD